MSTLANKIVELARQEVGVEEVDGTNCGKRVNWYKAATNLPPEESWPWCAAFVDRMVWEAMKALGGIDKFTFKRPTTAGAWDLENWSKKQDDSTNTKRSPGNDIQPGDIVIFTFSHVGLAIGHSADGFVKTVEGNSNPNGSREGGGVFELVRHVSKIKTRIRFTV